MCITEAKISFLRRILDIKLEKNDFRVNDDIVILSQILDKHIVKYQTECNCMVDKTEAN